MPMFEFRCLACGEEFEELLRSADEPVECPECDSPEVQRKMSTFGVKAGGGGHGGYDAAPASGGGSCSSCSGGNCGSCGH